MTGDTLALAVAVPRWLGREGTRSELALLGRSRSALAGAGGCADEGHTWPGYGLAVQGGAGRRTPGS